MKKETYAETVSGLQLVYEQACARNTGNDDYSRDSVLAQKTLETIKQIVQLRSCEKALKKTVIENAIGMT